VLFFNKIKKINPLLVGRLIYFAFGKTVWYNKAKNLAA